ncbi:YaaR family protein [Pontibacillus salicampi]|uniref:YaaR family protein n=1 Tax=Pontibacillus salicampi TaxID=1449801 RepID=A0ABV6LTV1_9BACI
MKIGQDLRTQLDTNTKNLKQLPPSGKGFDALVQTQASKMQENQLQRLMDDITKQGERVARFRSFKDLAKYKRLVKSFLEESVQYGMNLKQSHNWNMHGQSRKLTIVESVDEKLMELTDAVVQQEKKSIDILGIIGEIKGLLVNLYA